MPSSTDIIPSVTRNDGTLSIVVINPLTSPTTRPGGDHHDYRQRAAELVDPRGDQNSGESGRRRHRKIDTTDQNDKRAGEREHGQESHLVENVLRGRRSDETFRAPLEIDDQDPALQPSVQLCCGADRVDSADRARLTALRHRWPAIASRVSGSLHSSHHVLDHVDFGGLVLCRGRQLCADDSVLHDHDSVGHSDHFFEGFGAQQHTDPPMQPSTGPNRRSPLAFRRRFHASDR